MRKSTSSNLVGTKGERTKQRILDATILSVAKFGFEYTSVTTIAKIAAVNRGLVVHYFVNTKALMKNTNQLVMLFVIEYSTLYMTHHIEIGDLVERYINSTFAWVEEKPHYGQFVLLLITRSHYAIESRGAVGQIFTSGRNRLEDLILMGMENKIYQEGDAKNLAYQIHSMMVGHLIAFLLEQGDIKTPKNLAVEFALKLLRGAAGFDIYIKQRK